MEPIELEYREDHWAGTFKAMASPCEVLVELDDEDEAKAMIELTAREAWRIEHNFSRYRRDNIVYAINSNAGEPLRVDRETAYLLDFAQQCFELSEGLFDITSGILRKAWKFDGSDRIPTAPQVESLREFIGWDKVLWKPPYFTLPQGMEIDFGGIGKEYAVDRALALLVQQTPASVLVNLGGDLHVSGLRRNNSAWTVGIERPTAAGTATKFIHLHRGALTTSGDARRYLEKDGVRYSHVLDPHTGWPVLDAPRSVTVAANSCTEAGILSTLALLKGARAEEFLDAQGVRYWCQR